MFNAETLSIVLYAVIAVTVFVLLIWLRLTRAKRVGKFGEANIKLRLSGLPEAEYTVFNDILIPNASDTGTTQIDHVVVSPYGIFVIETKNYQGWIYGSEHAENGHRTSSATNTSCSIRFSRTTPTSVPSANCSVPTNTCRSFQ